MLRLNDENVELLEGMSKRNMSIKGAAVSKVRSKGSEQINVLTISNTDVNS